MRESKHCLSQWRDVDDIYCFSDAIAIDSEDNFRLPKASYATLKDKQLKEILLEHSLPTTGDRSVWIQRHQQCVVFFFLMDNCD